MKAGSKQFKEYVLDEKDYVNRWWFDIQNSWYCIFITIKKELMDIIRRQIISFSQLNLSELKTKTHRDILIQNFTKKMNKDNLVSCDDLAGSKKY